MGHNLYDTILGHNLYNTILVPPQKNKAAVNKKAVFN